MHFIVSLTLTVARNPFEPAVEHGDTKSPDSPDLNAGDDSVPCFDSQCLRMNSQQPGSLSDIQQHFELWVAPGALRLRILMVASARPCPCVTARFN